MPRRRKRVDWKGDDVAKKVVEATAWGVDKTTSECVHDAKEHVPFVTGTLEGSLRIEEAEQHGDRVTGRWGSFDVQYALAVEMGNPSLAVNSGDDSREFVKGTPRNTGNNRFLRGAADKEYPKLADRIAARFKKIT